MVRFKNEHLKKLVGEALTEELQDEYYVIGIRFENKVRQVGDVITECSRDNSGREDDRDFPEYGTPEYDEMDYLDGISTWDINFWEIGNLNRWSDMTSFAANHIYLIGGEKHSFGPDNHELVIEDGVVLAVIA